MSLNFGIILNGFFWFALFESLNLITMIAIHAIITIPIIHVSGCISFANSSMMAKPNTNEFYYSPPQSVLSTDPLLLSISRSSSLSGRHFMGDSDIGCCGPPLFKRKWCWQYWCECIINCSAEVEICATTITPG
jgi:hypothetical protein